MKKKKYLQTHRCDLRHTGVHNPLHSGTPTFSATAFMCHHNTFLVYQSMRNATMERWEKVTHLSVGFAWLVAACFGIAGYCTFRALSQGTFGGHTCSHIIC